MRESKEADAAAVEEKKSMAKRSPEANEVSESSAGNTESISRPGSEAKQSDVAPAVTTKGVKRLSLAGTQSELSAVDKKKGRNASSGPGISAPKRTMPTTLKRSNIKTKNKTAEAAQQGSTQQTKSTATAQVQNKAAELAKPSSVKQNGSVTNVVEAKGKKLSSFHYSRDMSLLRRFMT